MLLSAITHFLFSVGGSSFNPFEWKTDVKVPYVIIVFVIWIFPIVINYLDGEDNFKD
jgi:hypothetical protein